MYVNYRFQHSEFLRAHRDDLYKDCFGSATIDIEAIEKANCFINDEYDNYMYETNVQMLMFIGNYAKYAEEHFHHEMRYDEIVYTGCRNICIDWNGLNENKLALKTLEHLNLEHLNDNDPDYETVVEVKEKNAADVKTDYTIEIDDSPLDLYPKDPYYDFDFEHVFANHIKVNEYIDHIDIDYLGDGIVRINELNLISEEKRKESILEEMIELEIDETTTDYDEYEEIRERHYFTGSGFALATNICGVGYDYEKIKSTNSQINKHIIMEMMSPDRIRKFIDNGGDLEDYLN